MITFSRNFHYWNYFLAIEKDLENISRYIEFCEDNLNTYSIELARILLSASSEVDVVMKLLCGKISPLKKPKNIDEYREIIGLDLPVFMEEEISLPRFGMTFIPWENWINDINPDWWKSHTNIKHKRSHYFHEANLKNTINAVGALLLTVIYLYRFILSEELGENLDLQKTMSLLKPSGNLFETKHRPIDWFFWE